MNFAFRAGKRHIIGDLYQDVKRNRDARIPLNKRKLQSVWPRFVLTTLVETVEKRFERERQTLVPQDFNQIADHSRPRNYVGFIYADGNRMGEIIASMGTQFPDDKDAKQAYKAFSAITDEATRQAAVHGLKSHADTTPRHEPARFIPAESVIAGGGRSHPSGARSYRLAGGYALHLSISGAHKGAPARMGGKRQLALPLCP